MSCSKTAFQMKESFLLLKSPESNENDADVDSFIFLCLLFSCAIEQLRLLIEINA